MKGSMKLLKEHTISGHFVSQWRAATEGVGRLSEGEWIVEGQLVSHIRKKIAYFFLKSPKYLDPCSL